MASGINWDDVPEIEKDGSGIKWDDVPEKGPDSFGSRVLTGAADPLYGLAQLNAKYNPYVKLFEKTLGKDVEGAVDKAVKEREANYNAPEGFDAARMLGTALNPVTWVGPGKMKAGATTLGHLGKHLGKHLGYNTLQGLIMPTTGDDFVADKTRDVLLSNVLGGVMTGASKTGGGLYDVYKRNVSGSKDQAAMFLRDLFGDRTDDVVSALRNKRGPVEGYEPTAATTDTVNFPELVGLENRARKIQPSSFTKRDEQNSLAIINELDDLIGEGQRRVDWRGNPVKTPIRRRTAEVTGPMYDDVADEVIPFSEDEAAGLMTVIRDKEVEDWNRMVKGGYMDMPEIPMVNLSDGATVGELHAKRKVLDDIIKKSSSDFTLGGASVADKAKILRTGLSNKLREGSEGFAAADDMFSAMITPQNRADFVSQLRNKYVGDVGTNDPIAFLKALNDVSGTARSAGIPVKADNLTQLMRPGIEGGQQAIDRINALRSTMLDNVALKRSRKDINTGDLRGIGEKVADILPPVIDPKLTAFKKIMNKIGGKQMQELDEILAEGMLDTNKLADLIERTPPEQRSRVINAVREYSNKYGQIPSGAVKREFARINEE